MTKITPAAKIQLFSRKNCEKFITFVGVITSESDIFPETDKIYKACAKKVDDKFSLSIDSSDPQETLIAGWGCGEPTPLTDLKSADFDSLLTAEMWASYSDADPEMTGGYIFIRKSQNFKNENTHRYIICGAWRDTADFNNGEETCFYQAELSGGTALLEPSKPLLSGRGSTLGQLIKEPIWGDQSDPYRIQADIHLDILEHLMNHATFLAKGGDPKDYKHTNTEAQHLCGRHNDHDYYAFLKNLYKMGFPPSDLLTLQTEEYLKERSDASLSALNRS